MVPAKELAELRALESALRKERGILNAHCLIALNEGEVIVWVCVGVVHIVGHHMSPLVLLWRRLTRKALHIRVYAKE